MTKSQTIDGILRLNPSAKPEFLAQFSVKDLHDYLRQLEDVQEEPSPCSEPEMDLVLDRFPD